MYRLYLDEVGTDDLTHLVEDRHKYLSLTGVAIRIEDARDHLGPGLEQIKAEIFNRDPDEPFCFHRKEILGLKGPYEILRNDAIRARFNGAILGIFNQVDYKVITALIDKSWMVKQKHWTNMHPYHYLMAIIVEKYAQLLERINSIGDIMPESRQSKTDQELQKAYLEVRGTGTSFVGKDRIAARLRANNLKFRNKQANVAGLQLCDLLAHPSHIYARSLMGHQVTLGPFSTQVVEILQHQKYDRSPHSGKIRGYGIKTLP